MGGGGGVEGGGCRVGEGRGRGRGTSWVGAGAERGSGRSVGRWGSRVSPSLSLTLAVRGDARTHSHCPPLCPCPVSGTCETFNPLWTLGACGSGVEGGARLGRGVSERNLKLCSLSDGRSGSRPNLGWSLGSPRPPAFPPRVPARETPLRNTSGRITKRE